MFDKIPLERPETPLLDTIEYPADLRRLDKAQLEPLANELRHYLLYCVGRTGGHFGAGLGVIELTIALHYVLDTPDDRLVWDVGHQTYPHKILTGRRDRMHTLRQYGGLAPFPDRHESEFDTFGVGHSSTSISAALGMAIAAQIAGRPQRTVAVIGDGAMTAGMAFEALNQLSDTGADVLVILNDNAMSISSHVGGLGKYFARLQNIKPGNWFDDMGLAYTGPVDGHDLGALTEVLTGLVDLRGPRLLHVVTKKGKGYGPAEASPVLSHSMTKIEPSGKEAPSNSPSYANIFGEWLCDMAARDERLVGITPAMREGSDLVAFSERYPDRYFDTAIAEQHTMTFAAGLACGGMKPVIAIYSTFLQRGYDQLIHDIALQNLDILIAIDRAGLLEDGPTHSGVFDLSYLRPIPNIVIMAPSDEDETRRMLSTGYDFNGPAAVRYPRGSGPGVAIEPGQDVLEIGKSRRLRDGSKVAILAFGSMVTPCREVAERIDASLVDMRFVKPLDESTIIELAGNHDLLVTVEENVISGGAGSGVLELLQSHHISTPVLYLGIPVRFIDHD
ncbi:MAG: 1-deoxy-D-xylulose-5-phosphate synthase, partial [Pseudomonadales bacterium]|nr:1-deoxy-D-xylulose-5-phosphate synthase [Pseudomonadales bacterium]